MTPIPCMPKVRAERGTLAVLVGCACGWVAPTSGTDPEDAWAHHAALRMAAPDAFDAFGAFERPVE